MISSKKVFGVLAAAALGAFCVRSASATVITQWSFSATVAAPDNSPSPSTGVGTATTLGMTNSYNTGNTASDDVLSTPGTAIPSFSEYTWRIRGAQSPAGDNGWATYQGGAGAPEYSQGLELDSSTAGYQNIQFAFDWYSTTQGIRDLQFQYNTNVSNASGWTNFGGTSPTGTYIATSNDFYNAAIPPGTITVDLSSISGANNDPNFGIRLVSAFDSTGNVVDDYAAAKLSGGKTVIYNNNSGNWRFDNLTFSGTVVPEPASASLLGLAGLGLLARRRKSAAK
ncbi:MAG: PEP-CTERM sorting domain-containing protein [Tepidisphaeraceae bacterium]|jgi:PEP-CTERM motif-containing protein